METVSKRDPSWVRSSASNGFRRPPSLSLLSLVAFGYLGRAIGSAGARLAADGPSPALALHLRNLVWLSRGLLVILFVFVFVMTVKPGT
jgi:hypothetical protein